MTAERDDMERRKNLNWLDAAEAKSKLDSALTQLSSAEDAMDTAVAAARAAALEEAAKVADREAAKIIADEQERATWGGPDPRGRGASEQAYKTAREFRRLAAAIRAMIKQEDKG